MSKDEIIMRVRGSGCKMLDRLDLWSMSLEEIKAHLEKSCCRVYEKLKEIDRKPISKENTGKD